MWLCFSNCCRFIQTAQAERSFSYGYQESLQFKSPKSLVLIKEPSCDPPLNRHLETRFRKSVLEPDNDQIVITTPPTHEICALTTNATGYPRLDWSYKADKEGKLIYQFSLVQTACLSD